MSLITEEMRTASVEALKNTEVAVLTKAHLSQNLKKLPPYIEKIVSALTERLRTANENIHPYATGDCTRVVLKQLRLIFNDKTDSKPMGTTFPLEEIVAEISEDLGISADRVKAAIQKAKKKNLVVLKAGNVGIPDIRKFMKFTRSKREKTGRS
jgi:hypothetical protein